MAPVYKFTYFDIMGVGESIRYMMTYGGVNFENVAINYETQYPTIKKNFPFGRLPVLEFEGKVLYQPMAIARFLAKKFNLFGSDDFMNGQMDAIVETIHYLWTKVSEYYYEEDAITKTMLKKTLETEYFPTFLTRMNKMVETNSGFFFGKLSWVDFWFVGLIESALGMWGVDFLQPKYTYLYQLVHKIHSLPAIKTYISKRTEYDY